MKKLLILLFVIAVQGNAIAQSPSIGGYNVYYGILHNHTTVSDGTGTQDDAYHYARYTAGLDFFSTADHHNYIEESEWEEIRATSDKYNEDGVFTALWGFEWTGSSHVTVTNTEDYPGISPDPAGSLEQLYAWLDARNGVAFFNHPNRGDGKSFEGFVSRPCSKVVGMELFNSMDDFSVHYYNDGYWPDDGGLGHFDEALTRGWRIGAAGSDDNHAATWGTRTGYRLAILSDHLTRADLLEAMRARRFYSTLDKNIALSFKIDSSEMGSIVPAEPHDIHILATDGDGESFTRVMIFRNGFEFNTWDIDTNDVNLSLPVSTVSNEYYYIKVTQADGDEAISSPIFIKGELFNAKPSCSLTSPLNGTHFEAPRVVTITAEASDEDGSVVSVEFFAEDISLGSDTVAPYSMEFTIPANNAYKITAKVTDDNGLWVISAPIVFTVGVFSRTETSRISDGMSDVEEDPADGSIYAGSSDIELVYDNGNQIIGLRFSGLNIPPGETIDSAFIQFTVDEVSSGACALSIRGHNDDNSTPFTTMAKNVSSRVTTSAEVTWEPPVWLTVGMAGEDQKTPDLSPIIQEIVNRPGYTQSSAISIIITGSGERVAEAYEGEAGSAALMTVSYTFGNESTTEVPAADNTRFRIYPNPVTDGKLSIETVAIETVAMGTVAMGTDAEMTGGSGRTYVTITDLAGRVCYRAQLTESHAVLELNGIDPGLYIFNLRDGDQVYSHKLIVE